MKRRKKNQLKRFYTYLVILLFTAALMVVIMVWIKSSEARSRRYDAFGVDIPDEYTIHGIDVSKYQKNINWKEVRKMDVGNIRIGFVYIKATEGEDDKDPYFKKNWKQAAKNGIAKGAYHYFIPSKNAAKQAMNFIRSVHLSAGDLPPVLDVEQTNNIPADALQAAVKSWLTIVEHHYHIKPIIYTNVAFYDKYLGAAFNEYPLWIAHYYEKKKPRARRAWSIWQHNDAATVNGIVTKVDLNVFAGDTSAFSQMLVR